MVRCESELIDHERRSSFSLFGYGPYYLRRVLFNNLVPQFVLQISPLPESHFLNSNITIEFMRRDLY
jgi:hypothetical protein